VRCSVPGRDYSPLGIDDNAGSGGGSGAGGDGTGGTSTGQGGTAGLGGAGGQGGESPVVPIPCNPVSIDAGSTDAGSTDAGSTDAGSTDAGSTDAGSTDAACACVDGFIRAVDADGDGVGSRACSLAPGLDCDDNDAAVTHNSCNGCSVLPNAIGEDCLDCGSYVCDGQEALVCATKPEAVVVDPDCWCQDGLIVARDTDGDGQGTRLCEANPGSDCNDGDETFVSNQCGGCESLPGTVGAACNQCGVYACTGTALACVPQVGAGGQRCTNPATRETCVGSGFWGNAENCVRGCYGGSCAPCDLGTFRCTFYTTGDAVSACTLDSSTGTVGWASAGSCSSTTLRCNPANGSCTSGYFLLPRDQTFDVVPLLERGGPRWHDVLNTASDSDYG